VRHRAWLLEPPRSKGETSHQNIHIHHSPSSRHGWEPSSATRRALTWVWWYWNQWQLATVTAFAVTISGWYGGVRTPRVLVHHPVLQSAQLGRVHRVPRCFISGSACNTSWSHDPNNGEHIPTESYTTFKCVSAAIVESNGIERLSYCCDASSKLIT
jgi:hypothetical protein